MEKGRKMDKEATDFPFRDLITMRKLGRLNELEFSL